MTSRQNKLEFPAAGLAEKRNGAIAETFLATIVLHLLVDCLRILGTVLAHEDFLYHLLLVLIEKRRQFFVGDVPVIIDLRAKRMIESEAGRFPLFFRQALIERRN